MAIQVAINHSTYYRYDKPVILSPHVFRLRPAVHSRTKILGYSLKIKPENHFMNWQQDPFGNFLGRVVFPEPTIELAMDVEVIAELAVINPFDFFLEEYADKFPFVYDNHLKKELAPYLEITENGKLLKDWVNQVDTRERIRTVDFLVALNQRLRQDINYTIRLEVGVQTCEETLAKKLGSCRDSAWLLVQILRHLGLAARFVSGYLVQLTADVKSLDGPSGPEKDFTDLHAWTEVYVPGAGWIGLDPTSGLFASEGHIPLACTPDFASAAPVTGYLLTSCNTEEFRFSNIVKRIHEDPRVTKPYTEDQWEKVLKLGYQVDEDLKNGDVRLTMGGEPTFVAIDDMESAQWNTKADGELKRKLAGELLLRLKDTFGKNGLLHYGQGKWYPGEPIPRWQLGLFWRKDGVPIWRNESWIAKDGIDYKYTQEDAQKFLFHLCKYLNVNTLHINPAYEDAIHYIAEEQKLPININPLGYDLKDSWQRKNVAEVLQNGLGTPTGYVLPLKWNDWDRRWQTCLWEFRRGNLFLIAGNSQMGLRLPLNSLPEAVPEILPENDLFADKEALGDYHAKYGEKLPTETLIVSEEADSNNEKLTEAKKQFVATIRTALCIEAREGCLHIFMPPFSYLEQYLDLLAAIEKTAQDLQMPVRIEGYEPPKDWRIENLKVTPDPGVIEVNIHPSSSWADLVKNTESLYEQAHLSRLGTEKFMIDGRHTGTGGGNHVTIGGITPSDSPILRRPDLLRSLLTYWQHHPSLSYLFSSAFVGPTSQAPRVDEGRLENLYELEIAFSQIPEGKEVPFWLTDRLFRHLLTDITGNTHRAEFCIDKLYSPDSASGRLGIVEFRGFDMPPHYRMSLVQTLLIRTLVARFWVKPYKHKLVRWGTELYDRFMLPHYNFLDMKEVVEDLQRAGYAFDIAWFNAFFEFRFPHYGTVQIGDVTIELRMAIEPWHVLGEESTNSGTARYVDSSVERIQVKISGLIDGRYILVCNGRGIPLKSTGIQGEYVAGVRYKAWQPWSALHPTIPVQSPLVFDVYDTWNKRSIGGCTYFVSHPGGRSYDVFPVNAYEAESRRISRFWNNNYEQYQEPVYAPQATGSSIGRVELKGADLQPKFTPTDPKDELNMEYPYTLDLRKL
jgi:uncharacterized protein (DUF2126 family)/transglutaminase-like putative cysteine protease